MLTIMGLDLPLNRRILNWVSRKIGHQVGNGECWTLAETALRESGARTSNDIMGADNLTASADYRWGELVGELSQLAEGDIIQFRNYVVTVDNGTSWWQESRPHHTAIVASVGANGVVEVLECNVKGSRRVQRNTLYFQQSSSVSISGSWFFYHPQPRA